jgi:hypothetical protein
MDSWWTPGRLLMDSWWTPGRLLMDSWWTPGRLLMDSWWIPGGFHVSPDKVIYILRSMLFLNSLKII